MIKIDKNVPPPVEPEEYPFDEMGPGDSFFVPIPAGGEIRSFLASVSGRATAFRKDAEMRAKWIKWEPGKGPEIPRFTSRKVTEGGMLGVRVWRVA